MTPGIRKFRLTPIEFSRLEEASGFTLKSAINLAAYTTLRIGGAAEYFAEPNTVTQLVNILKVTNSLNIPVRTLGGGSNLLVDSDGVQGLVLKLGEEFTSASVRQKTLVAGGAVMLPKIARLAESHSLSGIEFMIGVPGTVGGSVYMNAGTAAQGNWVSDTLDEFETVDNEGNHEVHAKTETKFAYRYSELQDFGTRIVTSASFNLESGSSEQISEKIRHNIAKRRSTQPVGQRTCGSVFRNPPDIVVAQLIEELGLKGFSIGGARISTIHANFIENHSSASSYDVYDLIQAVREQVMRKTNIELRPEVEIWSDSVANA